MTALRFPCTIFKTQDRMDDYSAEDMRYGDLTESQLKTIIICLMSPPGLILTR